MLNYQAPTFKKKKELSNDVNGKNGLHRLKKYGNLKYIVNSTIYLKKINPNLYKINRNP